MSEYLYEIMKRASIFVILAQTIVRFRPGESYEKYLKMLVSVMTMAVMVLPILALFKENLTDRFEKELRGFELRMEDTLSEAYNMEEIGADNYREALEKEIKFRLNNYLNAEGYLVQNVEIQGISDNSTSYLNGENKIVIHVIPEVKEKGEFMERCAKILEMEKSSLEVADGTVK